MAVFQFTQQNHDHNHKTIQQVDFAAANGGVTWTWRVPFQIFTTLLLSLLLPLSFLLLARLSAANYFSLGNSDQFSAHTTATKSILLYTIVSLVTAGAFVHGLTSSRLTSNPPPESVPHNPTTRLYLAWVLLCTFQVLVGLGIEGSISSGIDGSGFTDENSNLLIRTLLFVGMHETMSFWSRIVVKPVVEDTVGEYGGVGRWVVVERVGLALSLGALWLWRLRKEVDALVGVPDLMLTVGGGGIPVGDHMVVGVTELVGWWLYYLIVSIGTTRVLKSVIYVGIQLVSYSAAVCRNRIEYVSSDSVPQSHHRHLQLPLEDMV